MTVAYRNSVLGNHLNGKVIIEGEAETLKGEISPFSLLLWPSVISWSQLILSVKS